MRASGRDALFEHEVYGILASVGFEVPRHVFWAGDPDQASESVLRAFLDTASVGPLVLKAPPGRCRRSVRCDAY